jgi:heterodisulfide reductase subunit D
MEKKENVLDKIGDEIWFCLYCQMCKAVCTVHHETRKEMDSPEKRIQTTEAVRRGLLDWDKTSAANIQQCTLCRLCTEWCVTKQDVAKIMATARADIVNCGKAPRSVLELKKNMETGKNPLGEEFEKRFKDLNIQKDQKNVDVVYFVGCVTGYKRTEIAKATQKILDSAGIKYAVMQGDEWCCGLPAYELGLWDTAKEMAKHNVEAINATGAKTVVASCPGCARTLKLEYEQWGTPIHKEVLHHTEFFDQLIKEEKLKLRKPLKKVITYHDPCHLSRYLKVVDSPRNVLKNVNKSKLVEMWFNKEKTLCCGAGGGYRLTNPKVAARIEERVLNEACQVKAELLATACPSCKQSFLPHARSKSLEIKDISEIIASCL